MRNGCVVAALLLALGAGAVSEGPTRAAAPQDKKTSFLLFGNVFTNEGFSLPGAEVQVHRAGQKKARWKARSDRRGEFAIRVPSGAEYQVIVEATGFEKQEKKVDARTGDREDLVFRLKPQEGGK